MIDAPLGLTCCADVIENFSMNLSTALFVRLLCGIGRLVAVSFLLVPGLLLSGDFLASYIPSWRARHVDLMLALRYA
jgi:ABC-type lipoprotein release transport system permease subunit